MIGKQLGRYQIIEMIGQGGMGSVFRAQDERLDRNVAIKVLPPGTVADETARKRFRQEALALSKLNHPHIATIFDFDTQDDMDFLVMEYVAGQSLEAILKEGPLPESEVIQVAKQVLEALEEAHENGVIHRDLKPGNIVMTVKGKAKVLDFGLAKLLSKTSETMGPAANLTQTGHTVGTVPYMAPEQLQGADADTRSDIYSVGVVLYEMATGRRPFLERQMHSLIQAILNKKPPAPRSVNPKMSPALEETILKALEKNPSKRYQTASDFLRGLTQTESTLPVGKVDSAQSAGLGWKGITSIVVFLFLVAFWFVLNTDALRKKLIPQHGALDIQSLAVLPLKNLSGDPDQEYFTDGVTERLISELAQIGDLRVISLTSVMKYKNSDLSLSAIAEELNVEAVIEGSFSSSNNQVLISAKLIEAATERHLLVEDYEGELSDILTLQKDVARAVAKKFRLKLTQDLNGIESTKSIDPKTYEHYLYGRHFWNRRDPESLSKAMDYFNMAIDNDPTFALAYVGVADCYNLFERYGVLAPDEAFPKAKASANKALQINDLLGEAYASLGFSKFLYDHAWNEAEKDFLRSLELIPSYATAHHWYSVFLRVVGESEAAIREAKSAQELDPLSAIINVNLGDTFYYAGLYEDAVEQYLKTLKVQDAYSPALYGLGYAYLELGDLEKAYTTIERARGLDPQNPRVLVALGYLYGVMNKSQEAIEVLSELSSLAKKQYTSPAELASVYASLGDQDQAFDLLEEAFEDRDAELVYLRVNPRLASLRADARFDDLVRRVGFED